MRDSSLAICAALLALGMPSHAFASCTVQQGANIQTYSTNNINTHTHLFDNVCGSRVTGNGCTLTLSDDVFESWTDTYGCLSIGRGVTVDGNGKTFECDDHGGTTPCINAAVYIMASEGESSGVSQIKNITFAGAPISAAIVFDGTPTDATNVKVQFPVSCPSTTFLGNTATGCQSGLHGFRTVSKSSISNAQGWGVLLATNGELIDSVVYQSVVAVKLFYSGGKLTNALLVDNDYDLWSASSGIKAASKGSAFEGSDCKCTTTGAGCASSITDCATWDAAERSFVEEVRY